MLALQMRAAEVGFGLKTNVAGFRLCGIYSNILKTCNGNYYFTGEILATYPPPDAMVIFSLRSAPSGAFS